MGKVKLSAQSARDMQPGDKPIRCHVVTGLTLKCGPRGKSWLYYYETLGGVRRNPKVGSYPELSLEAARAIAKDWYEKVRRGEDPSAERQDYRGSPTVTDFCDTYLKDWAAHKDKPRTLAEKKSKIERHIKPKLGKLKVVDVTLAKINEVLDSVAEVGLMDAKSHKGLEFKRKAGGATAARHVRSLLSSIFSYAEHDDVKLRDKGSNPVADSKTFAKKKRRRHLTGAEAPKVAAALDALSTEYPQRVAALWVILLAGTRVTELITAKRSQREGNLIYLDEHKTMRTGDERVIVLPRQALSIIEALPVDGSGYIFGLGLTRHNIFTVWDKARAAAGCPDLRVQDFRRSFASAAKSAGRSIATVGELLGHKDSATTDAYAFLYNETAEAAAQDTADELEGRLRPKPEPSDEPHQ